MIRIQRAYERPIKEVEFYFIKMVIIVILHIYVDSLINWETTAKSRWPMGSWAKATEVSLEREKQTWESLSKWKQQNLTLWLWRVRDEEASKNHLLTGRAAMPLMAEQGGGKLSTGSVEYPVPLWQAQEETGRNSSILWGSPQQGESFCVVPHLRFYYDKYKELSL